MQPTIRTLDNGLTIVSLENHSAPVVALEVWVGVGSADELAGEEGLAHVHEHMLFKGTQHLGVGEVASEVEGAGGDINAQTSFDYTTYHIEMSSRFMDRGVDILADVVQYPLMDADELARELEVIQEEIKRAEDSPGYRTSQMLFSAAFEKHPYGLPIIGTPESVASFERAHVLDFFGRWYVPSNLTFVAVGDFETEALMAKLEAVFDRPVGDASPRALRAPEPEQRAMRVLLEAEDVQENHLHMAFPIPALTHEDVPALDLLSLVLGGGGSSRLETIVRREKALVNAIGSYAYTPREGGLFTIGATFQETEEIGACDVLDGTLGVLFETGRLTIGGAELSRAKTTILSQQVYEKQTMRGLAQKFGYYLCVAGGLEAEQTYLEAVARATPEDLRRVAHAYLRPEKLTLAMISPLESPSASLTVDEVRASVTRAYEAATRPRRATSRDAHGVVSIELAGGTRLIVQRDDTVPLLSAWIAVQGGVRTENSVNNGVSYLTSQLLTRGTANTSATAIAQRFDDMGGMLSGYTGHNTLGMSATLLSQHRTEGLELLAECWLRPALELDEVERERALQVEELRAQEDQLAVKAFSIMGQTLYGAHPYGLDTLGTEGSVSGLTQAAVQLYHASRIDQRTHVVSLVGDIAMDEAVALAEQLFDAERPASVPLVLAPPTPLDAPKLVVYRREREQAHVAIGMLGAGLDGRDRYVLDVISALLSGQGGRLFVELRDKQSLAYTVGASNRPDLDPGTFSIYVATSPNKLQQALRGIGRELAALSAAPVRAAELERAKRYLIGTHDISLQRASTRASMLALNELYGLGHTFHWRYSEEVERVTLADVHEVANRVLDLRRAAIAVVAPADTEVTVEMLLEPATT